MDDGYDQYLAAEGLEADDFNNRGAVGGVDRDGYLLPQKTGGGGDLWGKIGGGLTDVGLGYFGKLVNGTPAAPAPKAAAPVQNNSWMKPALIGGGILIAVIVLMSVLRGGRK